MVWVPSFIRHRQNKSGLKLQKQLAQPYCQFSQMERSTLIGKPELQNFPMARKSERRP